MLGVKVQVQCVTCLCLIIISYVWWMWCNLLSLLTSSINCVTLKDAHKLLKAKNRPQNAVFFTHHSNFRSDTIICRSNCQEVDSVNYFCFVHCVAAKLIQFPQMRESTSPPFNYALIETTEFFLILFFTYPAQALKTHIVPITSLNYSSIITHIKCNSNGKHQLLYRLLAFFNSLFNS